MLKYMAWDNIPRTHSFSLGDFYDYDRCPFKFFVKHHLRQKYELAEGSSSQAIGTLLDLAIKKLHAGRIYDQPIGYLPNLIKAAELEIKTDAEKKGRNSFYGALAEFITPELIQKTNEIFKNYYLKKAGKISRMVLTKTLQTPKPFWSLLISGNEPLKLWGGPDSIEMGEDQIPEVVDYKYLERGAESTNFLDMDLMPKVYTLLCASELMDLGYSRARFVLRLWHDPDNDSFYEEFDLGDAVNLSAFLKDKMERILRTTSISFCNKDYCKVCQHPKKAEWIKQLSSLGLTHQ